MRWSSNTHFSIISKHCFVNGDSSDTFLEWSFSIRELSLHLVAWICRVDVRVSKSDEKCFVERRIIWCWRDDIGSGTKLVFFATFHGFTFLYIRYRRKKDMGIWKTPSGVPYCFDACLLKIKKEKKKKRWWQPSASLVIIVS